MKDFQEFIDTIEKCFCAIALEGRADRAFFRDIFRPTRENLYDAARKTKLDDLSMDWMAYELAMIFSQWAQLYTDTQYATMEFEAFKQLNLAGLHFDNTDWRDECKRADQAATPIQRVNPPCKATPITAPARGYKRGRGAAPAIGTPGAKRQRPRQHRQDRLKAAKPAARGQAICLRHLLHNQDPAQFPDGCKAPPPCSRNHNVQLHAGKLASLANMKGGIFPAAATKYIVAHL